MKTRAEGPKSEVENRFRSGFLVTPPHWEPLRQEPDLRRFFVMDYSLGGVDFKNKIAIRNRVSSILKSYTRGMVVVGEDERILRDLIKMHPRANEKIGTGIKYFRIGADHFGKNCFWINRSDDSRTDFSYLVCINGEKSNRLDFTTACRLAVIEQILAVSVPGTHVHHEGTTFQEIVDEFIAYYSLDISSIRYADGDGVTESRFLDLGIESRFATFHRERANLIAIPPEEHRKITHG